MVPVHSHLALSSFFRVARVCLWILVSWGLPAAQSAEPDAQAEQWLAAQAGLKSWSADFTQTRSLKVLAKPLVSSGKVWVVPGQFRWELGKPAQTIVIRQPDQLLIYYPLLKRVEKYPFDGVPTGPMKDALALMDASIPRDRAAMEAHFHLLSAKVIDSNLQLDLQPRSDARKFIQEIIISFRTDDFSIAATEMKFADGSSLRNDFAHVVRNQPIAQNLFELKPPPDVSVVEPLKP